MASSALPLKNNEKKENKQTKKKKVPRLNVNIPEEEITLKTLYTIMQTNFKAIDKRFDGIDTRLNKIDTRLDGHDKQLKTMSISIDKITKYNNLEDIQEQYDAEFITALYKHNYPMHFVKQIFVKDIYQPFSQNKITDLDGFLLISNNHKPFRFPLHHIDKLEYIFIESKHSISKFKIEFKIKQIVTIKQLLRDITVNNIPRDALEPFTDMIEQWVDETTIPINELNREIHLLFCSNDITEELREYIHAIYTGILDKNTYDAVVKKLFYSNQYVKKGLTAIHKNKRIPQVIKDQLKEEHSSMDGIRALFTNELAGEIIGDKNNAIKEHLNPYTLELEEAFNGIKGHIGFVQFRKAEYEPLFHTKSLNNLNKNL
jgi:hypothetical protein